LGPAVACRLPIEVRAFLKIRPNRKSLSHGDSQWKASYRTPAGRDAVLALYGGSFDLLLGQRTYDGWSGFWPKAPSSPMSDALNAGKKYVATRRPESLQWGPFEGLGPDIVEDIRRIKSHNVLLVYPVLLGKGKRLFGEGTPPRAFEPASTKALSSGIVINANRDSASAAVVVFGPPLDSEPAGCTMTNAIFVRLNMKKAGILDSGLVDHETVAGARNAPKPPHPFHTLPI
jgi:dihydrofolate reductase